MITLFVDLNVSEYERNKATKSEVNMLSPPHCGSLAWWRSAVSSVLSLFLFLSVAPHGLPV